MFSSKKFSQFRTKIHPGDAKIIVDELAPYREKSSEILIFNGFYNLTRKCEYEFWSVFWSLKRTFAFHFTLEQIELILTHVQVLLISQLLFGVFPLMGLKHVKTSSKLKFSFRSFQFVYSAIIQCGMIVMFSTSIYNQLRNHIEYTKVGNLNISTLIRKSWIIILSTSTSHVTSDTW